MLLISVLVFLPVVSATLTISDPVRTAYNFGDTIDVSGSLQVEQATKGYLQLSVACLEKTMTFPKVSIDLNANEKVLFSDLSLPTLTASSSMEGVCSISAVLLVNNVVVESATSHTFEVSGALEGTFAVDKTQAQLGDTIAITGDVHQLDGDPVDGSAELYFVNNGEEYLIDFLTIEDSIIDYNYTVASGTAGKYTIDLIVRDGYGNEQEFSDADSFTLLDQLYVFLQTNEANYRAGDTMNLFGDVKTILQSPVLSGDVEVTFDGTTESIALGDSKFTHDIVIPLDIKSGEHAVKVSVRDAYGNSGSGSMTVNIDPTATALELTVSNDSVEPNDKVSVTATLYDQAGDVMDDTISLVVYDADGQAISQKEIISGETVSYQLPKFAPPGQWVIKGTHEDDTGVLEEQTEFLVEEVKSVSYSIDGTTVTIRNNGNVRYIDDFELQIDGGEQGSYTLKESENLGVNETIVLDLADELPSGIYDIAVPSGLEILDIGKIAIENGTPRSSLNIMYSVLAVLFLGGLTFVAYKRFIPKKERKQEQPIQSKVAKKQKAEKKIAPKKPSLTFEDKKVSIEDFKKRTLEEIQRTEEKIKRDEAARSPLLKDGKIGYVTGKNDTVQQPAKKEEAPSVFSLFDED